MTEFEKTFKGMTVEEGFLYVLIQLEPSDIEYAIDTRHDGITPFGNLGDICDHNMLYPFADEGFAEGELNEWTDFANAVADRFNQYIFETRNARESQG